MKHKSRRYPFFSAFPFIITAACFGLMVYAAVFGEPFNISREDGLLEWGSVYFFLVGACLSLLALKTRAGVLEKRQKIFLLVFALLLFFGAGEEISWGQRFVKGGYSKSEVKKSDNLIQLGKGDTSIHNIRIKSKYVRFSIGSIFFGVLLLLGLLIHGIWLPRAVQRKNPRAIKLIRLSGLFVPPLRLGVLVFVSALIFHYLKRAIDLTQTREYKEFIIPFIYCTMLIHSYFIEDGKITGWVVNGMIFLTGLWLCGSVYFFVLH